MNRRLRAILVVGAVAMVTLQVITSYVPGPAPPLIWIVTPVVVGSSFLVAGIAAWQQWPTNRIGLLFTVVGYAWLLPSAALNLPFALTFTFGNLAQPLYQAPQTQLALSWPYGRLRSRFEAIVVVAEYAWIVCFNLVGTMFWDPRTNGCVGCPANVLLLDRSNRVHNAINASGQPVGLVIGLVVLVLIFQHWRSARGWSRRAMAPLVGIAVAVVALDAAQSFAGAFGLPISNLVLYAIAPLVLLTGPALVVAAILRARSAQAAVGGALVGLEPGPPPDRLRDALARALGDPDLRLAFRRADGAGHLDTGQQDLDTAAPGPGRVVADLDASGDAVLVYDESLVHEPQVVQVALTAANLALEHARLQAAVEEQLQQVRASRARIVEAGDAERRRLERDLHDGAQQRLVTLSLALGMAHDRAAGIDPELESLLESASKEAREALVDLRELARGIHPAVLTETGLSGALHALVERSAIATTIVAVPEVRFSGPIEATAYFVVSEALANAAKHAAATEARVTIRHVDGQLVVEVSDNGIGGARPEDGSGLRGLADRVGSVAGTLRVDSPAGRGTVVAAEIPCR